MRILIAPDKFKGSLSALEVANTMEDVLQTSSRSCHIIKIPLADGGEGTSKILGDHFGASKISILVHDPLMRKIRGYYYYCEARAEAYIEMAVASGLTLLECHERDPLKTTSFGTGELILDAIHQGAQSILLCIGGSATNDAGIGMANALGYRFMDENNQEVEPVGASLTKIKTIIPPDQSYRPIRFTVLTDVTNPLYGPNGAAFVYGPQKGASKEACKLLDAGLHHFSALNHDLTGKDISQVPGSGAAGGLGAGAMVFLNARLTEGADYVLDLLDINTEIAASDLIITGEGCLDRQTLSGKVVAKICERCLHLDKPVIAVCGINRLTVHEQRAMGLTEVLELAKKEPDVSQSMTNAPELIRQVVRDWMKHEDML